MSTKPITPYYQDSILEITKLKSELDELNKRFEQLLQDSCDTDSSIRETLRPLMDVDGDSHGVPPLEDLVGQAAKELKSLCRENARLREALEKIANSISYNSGENPYGVRIARAALNPPKPS